MRSKWQRNYDTKLNDLLGMKYQTARFQLERMFILHLCRKCGMGDCSICGCPIESVDEMSIEHKLPWGGNTGKNIEPNLKLFWDMNNLSLAHRKCNFSAGSGGSGKLNAIGVNYILDKRKNPPKEYARGAICVDNIPFTLGYYKTTQEAAMSYDIMCLVLRGDRCLLNYPNLKTKYLEHIEKEEKFKNVDVYKLKQMSNDRELVNILKRIISSILEEEKVCEAV